MHILIDQAHRYFKDTATGRQRASLIIPEPFFVHSELTTGIQIADLAAYCISWGFRIPSIMTKPIRAELAPYGRQLAKMRHRTVRNRMGNPNFEIWSFAHISDSRRGLSSLGVADIVEFAFLRSALVMIIDAANFIFKHAVFFRKHGNNDASPLGVQKLGQRVRYYPIRRIVTIAVGAVMSFVPTVSRIFCPSVSGMVALFGFRRNDSRLIWLMALVCRKLAKDLNLAMWWPTLRIAAFETGDREDQANTAYTSNERHHPR